jgi:hypothetical protein
VPAPWGSHQKSDFEIDIALSAEAIATMDPTEEEEFKHENGRAVQLNKHGLF